MNNPQNPSGPKTRRSRFERDPHAERKIKRPSELDLDIFWHLKNARFLSTDEICDLLEKDYNHRYIQTRLTQLYRDYWIDRPEVQHDLQKIKGTNSLIFELDAKGAKAMRVPEKKALTKASNLEHKHMIGSFYISLSIACRDSLDVELAEWDFEPRGKRIRIPGIRKITGQNQDGRFVLHMPGRRALFFYEAETGENSGKRTDWDQTSWWKKVLYYTELWRQYRHDYERDKRGSPNFLVLTALPEKKEKHLKYLIE